MSIPLPVNTCTGNGSHKAWEIFLDNDERWEVYKLKAKERPHLLLEEDQDGKESKENDNIEQPVVTDGCDIPAWRRENIMETTCDIRGVLNLGASCFYFRKESQWPVLNHTSTCWDQLYDKLTKPPMHAPPIVNCEEASELVEWKSGYHTTKFAWEWERKNQPVVITHCTDSWDAMPSNAGGGWTFDNLLERFRDITWRFSDNHGEVLTLETYNKYMRGIEGMSDDSPLAIYDALFGDDAPTNVLVEEYDVPACFSPDIFEYANDTTTRPPYRWILIGPARSGTGLHIDPLWTNAWVTVLQGCKRWMLFPKETPPDAIGLQDPQIPSVIWFRDYYDIVTSDDFPWKPVEVLQYPGETVFVPNGWPHLVLNLELTVAATHNYASEFGPFLRMWKEVVVEEPEFAHDWYAGLQKHRPDLAATIKEYHCDNANEVWAGEFHLCK